MTLILALDQGTTSSRAALFDAGGKVIAMAQRELPQVYPQPGWVEQDAETVWQTQYGAAQSAIAQAKAGGRDIAAIAITNQRETTVVWDRKTGKPIANAIVWQDRRTAAVCDALRAKGLEPEFKSRTGLLLDPYFSGTKIQWLLDHVPGARERAHRGELVFGTVDTWLIWKLTAGGVHVTDATNASRTLLFDIHRRQWDEALIDHLTVPRSMLPRVVACDQIVGESNAQCFGHSIPIAGIAGDQQAALFGQRCVRAGMAKNTYGTGCFLLMCTGESAPSETSRLLGTIASVRDGKTQYAIEGAVFNAGATVQWLRDGLGVIADAAEIEPLAASVADSADTFLVPAFTGLGAPYWDPQARGIICGLTRGVTRAHLARAALEAIAHQTADVVTAMRADSGVEVSTLRVDGGAARNNLLLQIQADLLGIPVVRSGNVEATAFGAAMLAGLAVGVWHSGEELDVLWRADRTFEPQAPGNKRLSQRARWADAVERAKAWAR